MDERALFGEPGTYRTRDGALVHCRRRPDGSISVLPECLPCPHGLAGATKLSDDPDWLDESSGRTGVLITD